MEKESKHDEDAESRLSRAVEFIRKSATEGTIHLQAKELDFFQRVTKHHTTTEQAVP